MDWKDVAAKILDLAPAAGAIFGGPVGAGAGTAVKMVANALGVKSADPQPAEIMAALANPQAAINLQTAAMQYQHDQTMAEIADRDKKRDDDLAELTARLADVQNARGMKTEGEKTTGKRDINLYVLAYLYTGGFFFSIILTIYLVGMGYFPKETPQAAVLLLGALFGALTAGSGAVVQYFFGSSKGSKDKDLLLLQSQPPSQQAK